MDFDYCLYSSVNKRNLLNGHCDQCEREDYMGCEILKKEGNPEAVKDYLEIKLYLENRM